MPEPEIRNTGETGLPAAPWLVLLVAAGILVGGTLLNPDLALIFLLGFAVIAFVCWKVLSNPASGDLTRNYSKTTHASSSEVGASVVEAMQHPVMIVDQRANLVFANSKCLSVFGPVKPGEMIFIRFRQPILRKTIEEALETGRAMKIEYNESVAGDRWFAVEISPIPTDDSGSNQVPQYIVSFQDLTETKRIDQMRSDFIANASHELRTPLASLVGYLETLKGPAKKDAKARARFVDIMLEQAERMSRLVNDLLSLSRIEMKAHLRPSDSVDISEVVSTVVNALEPLADQMNVQIKLDIENRFMIKGDRDELVQVFENIIENGCKYGQDGKRVNVSVFSDNPENPKTVTVSVKDFGPGISAEHQHRITERFYRVDVARSREKQGTGLGLAIVKHILQRHGTRLSLMSGSSEGSEFFVTFDVQGNVD